MQLQHQVPGKVPEGTTRSGADAQARFRDVLAQSLDEVPKSSDAEPRRGSGGFRCRGARVLVQIPGDVSGADVEVRFRKVPVQKVLVQKVPDIEVRFRKGRHMEGSGYLRVQ